MLSTQATRTLYSSMTDYRFQAGWHGTLKPSTVVNSIMSLMLMEVCMPYVNIKITREGATAEQKKQLIAGVTQLLVDTLGKNPATTVVVIDEVDTDNWGIGGQSVTELRKSS
jgi:4-oxalocrotonate tautomerase